MEIIQIILPPDIEEGTNGGYYNYEFGVINEIIKDENRLRVKFNGPQRYEGDRSIRTNYMVDKEEVAIIIGDD